MSAPFSYVEIEAVDELEFEIPCGVRRLGVSCEHDADWILTKICCDGTSYECDSHFQLNGPIFCRTCGAVFQERKLQIKNAMRIK